MACKNLLLCLLIVLSASCGAADSIHGCGGFVEASSSLIKSRNPSDAKLDYSNIMVELRTVDGLVKDMTYCAPNGYYFIPVYDKGSFIVKIKGPDGWSWDHDNVPVTVDHNGCNANSDINFRFTGFMVSGRVMGAIGGESCYLKDGGPSNVKVDLLSPSDDLIASSLTSAKGDYSLTNIIPGKYKLRTSHPNFRIELRGSSEVDLGFGNAVVDNIFFVTGYDLHGSVVAQGNPILGVHIYLYSDDVTEVHCPQGVGNAPRQNSALCHAISDANGKFTFSSIPCGTYELLPYYKGENTIFDVSPPSMVVSVEHRHITLSQKFQVTGFSIGGRVVDGNGAGVDGVKVLVDGQWRTITDHQGFYKLDQVTSKHYSIMAEKDHYKFSTLENFLVLPNMAYIDNIKAVNYDICGVVGLVTENSKAKVALTHGPENFKPQRKLTNEDGSFCFEVPPGEYRLSALSVSSDSSSALLFSPPHVDLKVDSPLLNLEFVQAQVDIHGSVLCKEKCTPSIVVSLVRLLGQDMKEKKTISLSHESNIFTFSKVLPGKYRLEVKHVPSPLMPEEDSWCWDQKSIDLDVGIEDIKGISFVQKGYWIDINSTHDTDAYILQPDLSRDDLLIKRGSQRICIETPGHHELYTVNSCIFFGNTSMKFNTLNPMPIYLTGKKYLIKGEIHVGSSLQNAFDLSEHITVDVFNKGGTLINTINIRLVSAENEEKSISVYEYLIWSDLGEEFIFVPRDSSDREKKILFYPRQCHLSVTTDGCQAISPPFVGRVGLYLEGSISPGFSGVNIRILATGDSSYAPLRKGDVALETETRTDGSYVAGPLYDDISYKVEASKPGYHLKQLGPHSFTCQKLSQILVNLYDDSEAKVLLPSVLLSLSGEDGYRNNSISGVGGTFTFDNLFPGSFYLRPLLKEYSFSPMALAIELESGEFKEVVFTATRVAYSIMGTVSLLSGQPKEGVYIEARSESKGYYEEAKTDYMGNFRLRGLLPDTTYLIKVAEREDLGVTAIERASPKTVAIKIGSEDIRGMDFVVFEKPEMTILSGHVEGVGLELLQPHLSVEIKSAGIPSKIELVFPLPLSYYFEARDLPKGKHLVQLRSGLPSATHKFESEILEIDLEKQPQIHVGPLTYKVEEYHHKQEPTAAPLFPLVVGVSVIALFICMPRLKDLYQTIVEMTPLGSSAASSKKEARKPVLRKRVL